MALYTKLEDLIGNTPLFELCRLEREGQPGCRILAKLENLNPAGSAKDRVALSMLRDAEEKGLIGPGAVIIEPTSGNTGVALAALAAARGYRAIFTMPETMSVERQKLLAAYGAEIVLTPGDAGMQGAVDKAEALARELPGSFIPGQFDNPANPAAHKATTGPEIWKDTEGRVDALVAGAGTGGTFSGTAAYLKEQNKDILAVAVEPASSPLLSKGTAGPHGLMGIGANFIPDNLDRSLIDRIQAVTEEEAYGAARQLAREEGILAGITGGAALFAAMKLAKEEGFKGKTIVVILPDGGERYLSTPLFG